MFNLDQEANSRRLQRCHEFDARHSHRLLWRSPCPSTARSHSHSLSLAVVALPVAVAVVEPESEQLPVVYFSKIVAKCPIVPAVCYLSPVAVAVAAVAALLAMDSPVVSATKHSHSHWAMTVVALLGKKNLFHQVKMDSSVLHHP